jgi:hypothetical protein
LLSSRGTARAGERKIDFFNSRGTTHTLTTHAQSPIHVRKPYPYEHLRRTEYR